MFPFDVVIMKYFMDAGYDFCECLLRFSYASQEISLELPYTYTLLIDII